MLPVHDHNARTSTQIAAPMGLATILRPCEASASGWHCEVLLGKPSLVHLSLVLPRFEA